ncbi:Mitogen-activated protein kinase kinase 1 [Hibiscus syriacus]|uniref:mitogen-activated protein kinase kinase n=1 Tax=Hibiscus syriacus TaxID=106335 RepID=A0A6A2YTW2_HIBSY|nr:Mitogen-activated protein kinase kinase 1 [Hibiscus syriacus]
MNSPVSASSAPGSRSGSSGGDDGYFMLSTFRSKNLLLGRLPLELEDISTFRSKKLAVECLPLELEAIVSNENCTYGCVDDISILSTRPPPTRCAAKVEALEQQQRLRRTEDVALWLTLAEAMLGEVNIIIQQGDDELRNKCVGDCCPRNLKSTYKIGKRVVKKMDSVKELLNKAERFYSESAIVFKPPRNSLLMPEWPLENTVGLDSAVDKVWEAIENENVRIIRLCGQGGVGKTTLLKKVCNEFHRRSHDFDVVIWAMVPTGEGYIQKIQELIRKKLDIPDEIWNQSGEDEKGAEIFRVLKRNKFVFLLDNVWEPFDLIRLGIKLSGYRNQSKVIFTTRSLRLYLNFFSTAHETIEVKCLPPEEALSLFRMTVGESVLSSDADLSELADTCARKCRGLPLALLTFARAMAGLDNPRQWRHTIELLHSSIRDCRNGRIDELIDLWVGEGFLHGSNPCDRGGFIVDALKSAYLLETDESKQCVRMHDIFRHMALWLARDQGRKKNKVLVAKSGRLTDRELRKWEVANWISLFGCIITKVNISRSPSCPYLTTLLLRDGEIISFPDRFFDSMPVLKVLDLSGNRSLVELPSNIGNAKTLKYLNLSLTSLEKLPTDLGNLRNLRCLLLDYTMNLKWIPKEVISNLLLLQVYSKINGVDEHFSSVEKEVSNLESLEIFRCSSLKEFKVSVGCKVGNLSKVSIGVCPLLLNLNALAYARNLEILKIFDCEALKEVTSEEMAFPRLKTVYLTRLLNLKRICPSSSCFPSLLEIEVSKCQLLRLLPFDLGSANLLQKIIGEIEWWNDLIWDDEAVKHVCCSKFVSTPSELIQNLYPPRPAPVPPIPADPILAASLHAYRAYLPRPHPETPAVISSQDLDVIKVISKGYSSTVQLVQHKWTGQLFALKIIEMDIEESVLSQIARKWRSIQSSRCPFVVVHYSSSYKDGVMSNILEYMDGGSLADFLKKVKSIPEPYLAAICKQTLKGLIYLHHEVHVIHRDIKPSKLLINHRGEVKITDFGESAELISYLGLANKRANTFVGTYNYMSPERICGSSYGVDADIWSLGIVLLECATGKFPYSPPEQAEEWTSFFELMEHIVEGPAPCVPSDQFSPEFCSFISARLQKDPKERKSAPELLELPFVKMYDDVEVDLSSYFSSADYGVVGMLHVGILCENLERSLEFYQNILGLQINEARPHDKLPYRGAWLWVGSEMIHLMELPNPDPLTGRPEHGGRDRHACISIRDVSKLQAILDKAGNGLMVLFHLGTMSCNFLENRCFVTGDMLCFLINAFIALVLIHKTIGNNVMDVPEIAADGFTYTGSCLGRESVLLTVFSLKDWTEDSIRCHRTLQLPILHIAEDYSIAIKSLRMHLKTSSTVSCTKTILVLHGAGTEDIAGMTWINTKQSVFKLSAAHQTVRLLPFPPLKAISMVVVFAENLRAGSSHAHVLSFKLRTS